MRLVEVMIYSEKSFLTTLLSALPTPSLAQGGQVYCLLGYYVTAENHFKQSANFLYQVSATNKHTQKSIIPWLHCARGAGGVSRLRGCKATCLHQIPATNNNPKNPQLCRPLVKGGGFRKKTGGIDLGTIN